MKVFKLIVNLDDETGLTFNALVAAPAHNKSVMAFSESKKSYLSFNDNKQMITGIAISANQLIERNSPELGKYFVYFEPKEVEKMILKMSRQKLLSSVNLMHDDSQVVSGITFIEGYFIDDTKKLPKGLDDKNVQKGSYAMTYYVEDVNLYNEIKLGKYAGYSIEGIFVQIPININNNKNKNEMKKSFLKKIFGEEKFAEVTTADGTVLSYEGELAVGTPMFTTNEAGEQVAAPAGDVVMEDGTTITIDGDGVVSAITPAEEMSEEITGEDVVAALQKMAKQIKESNSATNKRMDDFEKSFAGKNQKFDKSEDSQGWKGFTKKSK